MSKRIGLYPRVRVEGGGRGAVSQAGSVLLVETVRKSGLDTAISAALAPWRRPRAVHDPGKVLLDVALATALGGDCLADVAMLRAEPGVFGPVASDPTVSRLLDALAAAGPKALAAIRSARADVRSRVWELAGANGPAADGHVTVDIDGVLVLAHSEKQDATATWKKTFGNHPLVAFVDHGQAGSGEPVAALLRPGNAGSNTAADHITTTRLALAQLPKALRRGRQTLIRTDSAGGTHASWAVALQAGPVAVVFRRHDHHRHPPPGRTQDPEAGLDTGLRNLPLHDTAQNQIWLEIVSLALDLLAWMPMLALTGATRRWEPKRLRLRLLSAAAQLVHTGRRRWLRFTARWPWTEVITQAINRLQSLPNPG
ncbi:transposase [Streptomyces sp. A3M-1-3]|nr:transposase [Streptomyces sp. A3M-1-3]MCP3820230.1 transposase [Streptomyces sp. A3M-1-3]